MRELLSNKSQFVGQFKYINHSLQSLRTRGLIYITTELQPGGDLLLINLRLELFFFFSFFLVVILFIFFLLRYLEQLDRETCLEYPCRHMTLYQKEKKNKDRDIAGRIILYNK